jgi:transposase InsO family protein
VKTVAQTLGVSRSNLVRRQAGESKPRRSYVMTDDTALLPDIRALVDVRPTYGYRRIAALINRQRRHQSLPALNHKRIYRLMRQNNLLLTRHTGKPPGRLHEGNIITLRSNLRWASDGFEIPCWNRQVVRVTFVIDSCDREIIAWAATTGGFDGETVRDLMVLAVERRFGGSATPHAVEWLSDNGSAYTAHETLRLAHSLGLVPCFTPVRSPESNGMAEAFVKTFKRDYVYVHDRPDAATVLSQLDSWFDDYNDSHPHKGLKMKSPREFIRAQATAGCPIQ